MLEWRYLGMIAPMAPPRRLVTPRTTTVLAPKEARFRCVRETKKLEMPLNTWFAEK